MTSDLPVVQNHDNDQDEAHSGHAFKALMSLDVFLDVVWGNVAVHFSDKTRQAFGLTCRTLYRQYLAHTPDWVGKYAERKHHAHQLQSCTLIRRAQVHCHGHAAVVVEPAIPVYTQAIPSEALRRIIRAKAHPDDVRVTDLADAANNIIGFVNYWMLRAFTDIGKLHEIEFSTSDTEHATRIKVYSLFETRNVLMNVCSLAKLDPNVAVTQPYLMVAKACNAIWTPNMEPLMERINEALQEDNY